MCLSIYVPTKFGTHKLMIQYEHKTIIRASCISQIMTLIKHLKSMLFNKLLNIYFLFSDDCLAFYVGTTTLTCACTMVMHYYFVNVFQQKDEKRYTNAETKNNEAAGHIYQSQLLSTSTRLLVLHPTLVYVGLNIQRRC